MSDESGLGDEEARERWQHRKGDQYLLVSSSIVGNPDSGYTREYYWDGARLDRHGEAKRVGLRDFGSDDFNIGVLRGGVLSFWLWMDEVIPEPPEVLAKIAAELDVPASDPMTAEPEATTPASSDEREALVALWITPKARDEWASTSEQITFGSQLEVTLAARRSLAAARPTSPVPGGETP